MPAKYDRCIKAVKSKQTKKCQRTQQFGKKVDNEMCYNWFAICSKYRSGTTKKMVRRKIHVGPRGGKYIIVKGKKKYI